MKTSIASLCALALAFTVAAPSAVASTPADALQAVADLRSLTQVIPVTKASETTKIRADLIKVLDSSNNYLIKAGQATNSKDAANLYYKAALKVWEYQVKLGKLDSSGKVGHAEATILLNMAAAAQTCIVEVYYPSPG
jgi:hypothetical protein